MATDTAALGDHPPIAARVLANRGITTAHDAREFLDVAPTLVDDPSLLPDMAQAVERVRRARRDGEAVAVYGDFDADGVTGTALLTLALRAAGMRVMPYIPHRISEGHGLNVPAVEELAAQGAGLIVTVDCGVGDREAVARASQLGVDVVITDHHAIHGPLPDAAAVINPHVPGAESFFEHLTGVGMALKLASCLQAQTSLGAHGVGGELLELAAIGTVTDMAPLVGENRYIVHHGLRALRTTTSLGLRALLQTARVDPSDATEETIGFAIGPRLNAAGRLDSADAALELLLTRDPERARALAGALDEQNQQRQRLTEATMDTCRALLAASGGPLRGAVLVLGHASFSAGVVGLAAGKLVEETGGVPSAVYALDGERVLASCRSTPGFHWARALALCADLLDRHGGHAQAAGFACHVSRLPVLAERLDAIAAEWSRGDGTAQALPTVDAEVDLPQLMGRTFQTLQRLAPFGVGNPAPTFLTRGVRVESALTMGTDAQHLRLRLRAGGALWDAVAFRQEWVPGTTHADVVYQLGVDRWNGHQRLRVNVLDYAPAAG